MVIQFEVEYDEERDEFRIVSDGWNSTTGDEDTVVHELEEWLTNSVRV